MDNSTKQSVGLNVLLNTSCQISSVDTFSYRPALIFGEAKAKAVRDPNCLYAVTRSGKLYVYTGAPNGEFSYKICILPHSVEKCIKMSDFLIYSTDLNEIYALRLLDCFKNVAVEATFIKKFDSIDQLCKGINEILINPTNCWMLIKVNL